MRRREALALLFAAGVRAETIPGAAVLLDVNSGQTVGIQNPDIAARAVAPPGSAIKPFTLQALLLAGKLRPEESFACPGELMIAGRSYACSHPPLPTAVQAHTALAYSCNCFVAHMAERFARGELAPGLQRFGVSEAPGSVDRALTLESQQLQAIGEYGVLVTATGLARAYRVLALKAHEAVRTGMEEAVEFGTAQLARVPGIQVAGKTGSVPSERVAWFAGFAPSRAPKVAIAVMLQGHSGGSDAAPLAARLLQTYFEGRP